jgi:hypothetical protein
MSKVSPLLSPLFTLFKVSPLSRYPLSITVIRYRYFKMSPSRAWPAAARISTTRSEQTTLSYSIILLKDKHITIHHMSEKSFGCFGKTKSMILSLPMSNRQKKRPETRGCRKLCPTPGPDEAFPPGSRHNPLKKLDSDKAKQGNPSLFLVRSWLEVRPAWLSLVRFGRPRMITQLHSVFGPGLWPSTAPGPRSAQAFARPPTSSPIRLTPRSSTARPKPSRISSTTRAPFSARPV